jgi:uncharacterized protein YndB with AHSA1/START domain
MCLNSITYSIEGDVTMSILAKAQVDVAAPASKVWHALTDPALIAKVLLRQPG